MKYTEWVECPVYEERLHKLAKFLVEVVPEESFNFASIFNTKGQEAEDVIENASDPNSFDCGSVGCALGWTPKCFPELVEFFVNGTEELAIQTKFLQKRHFHVANEIFGMTTDETRTVFDTCQYGHNGVFPNTLQHKSSKEEVAARIEDFIKAKKEGILG